MKIIFNMGWWLERRMFEIKNRIEDEELPPRDNTVYEVWKAMYKMNRQDKDYKPYNQVSSPHILHKYPPGTYRGYRKISLNSSYRNTLKRK